MVIPMPRPLHPSPTVPAGGGIPATLARRREWNNGSRLNGFTLIELLVVLAIVALLLMLAAPRFLPRVDIAKETILAENLRNTRVVIAQFHADTGRYPDSLEQLVEKKYLPMVPIDPITESNKTWIVEPPPDGEEGAVYGIRSGAGGEGRSGKRYLDW